MLKMFFACALKFRVNFEVTYQVSYLVEISCAICRWPAIQACMNGIVNSFATIGGLPRNSCVFGSLLVGCLQLHISSDIL